MSQQQQQWHSVRQSNVWQWSSVTSGYYTEMKRNSNSLSRSAIMTQCGGRVGVRLHRRVKNPAGMVETSTILVMFAIYQLLLRRQTQKDDVKTKAKSQIKKTWIPVYMDASGVFQKLHCWRPENLFAYAQKAKPHKRSYVLKKKKKTHVHVDKASKCASRCVTTLMH